jgi:hypothetical protein
MRLLRSSSHAACSNLYDAIPLCPFSRSVGRWFDEKFWKDSEDKSWSWGRNCPRIAILIGFQYTSWIRGSNWPKQHTNCRRNDQLMGLRWSRLSHPIPIEWSWWRNAASAIREVTKRLCRARNTIPNASGRLVPLTIQGEAGRLMAVGSEAFPVNDMRLYAIQSIQ